MKTQKMKMLLVYTIVLFSFLISISKAYNVNDKVEVEWQGKWYPAKILQIDKNKYFIHYEGYDKKWDEWVGIERIKVYKNSKPTPILERKGIKIYKGGSLWYEIEKNGTIRKNGSIIGSIEKNGTIRLNGLIWGKASNCCNDYLYMQSVTAVIVFFDSDFGFLN